MTPGRLDRGQDGSTPGLLGRRGRRGTLPLAILLATSACGASQSVGGGPASPTFRWPKEARWTVATSVQQIHFVDKEEKSRTESTLEHDLQVSRDGKLLRLSLGPIRTQGLRPSDQKALEATGDAIGRIEVDLEGRYVRGPSDAAKLDSIAAGMKFAQEDLDAALRSWWRGAVEDWLDRRLPKGSVQRLASPRGETTLRFNGRERCFDADDAPVCVILERRQRYRDEFGPEGLAATKVLAERGITMEPVESVIEHTIVAEESTLLPHRERRSVDITFKLPERDGDRRHRVVIQSEATYSRPR